MKPIYLEPSEEITSVIDKLSADSDRKVALVVPKNSTLFQSVINLKLLVKEAKKLDKEVVLIAPSKIGERLAAQVGLKTYASMGALGKQPISPVEELSVKAEASPDLVIDGVRVNQYRPDVPAAVVTDEAAEELTTAPITTDPEPELSVTEAVEDEAAAEAAESGASATASASEETPELPAPEVLPELPVADEPDIAPVISKDETSEEAALPAVVARSGFSGPKKPIKIPWKVVAAGGVLLVVFAIIAFFFLPRATVKATLSAKSLTKVITLNAKVTPDADTATIPANLLSSEQTVTQNFPATGKKDIGTKASGTVTITNKYKDSSGSGKDETFAAGTLITDTKTKTTFSLNATVTVGKLTYNSSNGQPIYQSQSVVVTASNPGDAGNLPASSFSISGGLDGTTVESSSAFTGGVTKTVTVVAQSDIDTALSAAKAQMVSSATADLQTKASNQKLLDQAVWQEVKKAAADHAAGDQVESAAVTVDIIESALVYDPAQVETKVKAALADGLPTNQELVIAPDQHIDTTFGGLSADKNTLTLQATGSGYAVAKIDKAALIKSIKGKTKSQAADILQKQYGALASDIAISPSWWPKRLPTLAQGITFDYGFDTTAAPQ